MKTHHSLRKGDRLIVNIESIGPGGEGVAKTSGVPVFVSRVAPGDRVEIELFDVRKNFGFGKVVRLVKAAEARQEPPCKLFKVCGGCHWQHIQYPAQVSLKTDLVRQALKHIGDIDPSIVKDTLAADEPLFYRNKVQFPVSSPNKSPRILAGYYKEGSHELVNIKHCPVQPEPLDRLLEAAKASLEKHGLSAYQETSHSGVIRHIAARFSFSRREALATLVINNSAPGDARIMEKLKGIADELISLVPEIVGVCVNFNPHKGNKIMGREWACLSGRDHIEEQLQSAKVDAAPLHKQGITFKLTPTTFFQVNTKQSLQLLEHVYEAVQSNCRIERPVIADAYGGVGTIALWLSPLASKVICIEEVEAAIKDGADIASLNHISNVEYRHGQVESVLPELGSQPDVVVVDPPRKGLAPEVIDAIAASGAHLVVYVSCNPTTLARDMKLLKEKGYLAESVQPLDMFPQTHHVECIAVIAKENLH